MYLMPWPTRGFEGSKKADLERSLVGREEGKIAASFLEEVSEEQAGPRRRLYRYPPLPRGRPCSVHLPLRPRPDQHQAGPPRAYRGAYLGHGCLGQGCVQPDALGVENFFDGGFRSEE